MKRDKEEQDNEMVCVGSKSRVPLVKGSAAVYGTRFAVVVRVRGFEGRVQLPSPVTKESRQERLRAKSVIM